MSTIEAISLVDAVDAANDALFSRRPIAAAEREAWAAAIAAQHDQPGAYAHTFALTAEERGAGVRLFTGERMRSAAGRHIIGEEACRVLLQLKPQDPAAQAALLAASRSLQRRMAPVGAPGAKPDDGRVSRLWAYRAGTYCCGPCSVAFWRHILAGGFDHRAERLSVGLRCLKTCRKGDGDWRSFPYWYTVLALAEMDDPAARAELRYAAPRLERAAAQPSGAAPWSLRRSELARRVLAAI